MFLSFAPMEGITGAGFRRVHRRMFPEADQYYAPFIAPDAGGRFKQSHLRALLPDNNCGISLVPQILANSASAFLGAAETLAGLGYTEVNLNAGCPSGTVVAKHKGAGMLADLDTLAAFLDEVFDRCPLEISIKTRMGLNSTDEFPRILAIYQRYPVKELIVHARDRVGMYRSEPDLGGFAEALRACRCPICYNGNVFTGHDLDALAARFPALQRVMLGRGAVANPALFRQLKGGRALQREELREFHGQLLEEALAEGLAPQHAMARMKELWFYYSRLFPGSEKPMKAVYKARELSDYRDATARLFDEAIFDPSRGFDG